MNKSMTTLYKQLTVGLLITLMLLLSSIGLVTSCGSGATTADDSQAHIPTAVPAPHFAADPRALHTAPTIAPTTIAPTTIVAATPISPTQLFLAPVLQMEGKLTPFGKVTPTVHEQLSSTPTIAFAALLSQTVEVQAQVVVSAAAVARSLAVIVQPPITTTASVSPNVSLSLTGVSNAAVAITNSDVAVGDLPADNPIPALEEAPPLTITSPITQVSPYPVPAPPAELAPEGNVRRAYVPILMYHYLSVPPADTDIYRRDLSVTPERFAAHLDRLQAEGYTTISLYTLYAYLTQGTPLPAKPVIITFDDGYRDNYENALPLLTAHKMTATFFIVVDFIDRERPEYVSWEMVSALHDAGMSVEAHGVDHTTLRNRSQADLEFQALRSYETIQDRIGVRPRFFSYPAGEYDGATITMFQHASYWAAVTTVQGATHRSDELFTLQRVRVRSTTTADELINLLTADW